MSGAIHIIGAGLAGLSAAVRLRHLGPRVIVYEAAPRAGGRCRSFTDPQLGCVIDNGNHLLLSGNTEAMAYLAEIGAADRVTGPTEAQFDFRDLVSGRTWQVRPGRGRVPWWILDARRRVPDTRVTDYWSILRLMAARPDATVAEALSSRGALYDRFWEPLTVAVLNTAPEEGAAVLMQAALRETVARGAASCRPLIARDSLADTLVDPALAALGRAGVQVRLAARVDAIERAADRVTALVVGGARVALAADDLVILAPPPWIAQELVPELRVPPPGEPIVNVHYRLAPHTAPRAGAAIVGVIGGLTQWVFHRGDLASVTISAAGAVVDQSADDIAARCWPEVAAALGLPAGPLPAARVIKERRATPAQTPAAVALRPGTVTAIENLLLAGDWTDTGVPATIEGAVRSGAAAARVAAAHQRGAA